MTNGAGSHKTLAGKAASKPKASPKTGRGNGTAKVLLSAALKKPRHR